MSARQSGVMLAIAVVLLLTSVAAAHAEQIVAIRGGAAERYTPGAGWTALPLPAHLAIDGIAYDKRHHAYVVSAGAPGPCSFIEFTGGRVIARMSPAQFGRAAHTSFAANCQLHQDPAGGVLISASAGSLGSETSWSVNSVTKRASLLGYGNAATSDGQHVALVQHTCFPRPDLGGDELLAAVSHRSKVRGGA